MRRFLIYLIVVLAFVLRVVSLNSFPVGFTPDEASFGYDAYSILKTGKDQWGVILPLVLKSFGDYKPPLLAYLQIPFVALWGLNKITIRLPNAISGSLAVLATYLLVKELKRFIKFDIKDWIFGLIAAFLVAISSWHIMMSRGAFEANLITFFLPLGIYLFIKGLKDNKSLVFSSIIFGLNMFSYHSAKFITPIIYLGLVVVFMKNLKEIGFKKLILPIGIFTFFFLLLLYTFKLGGGTRVAERSVMQGSLDEGAKFKIEAIQNGMNPIVARILHNKYQVSIKKFIANYRQYFSYRFLFKSGPGEATYGMIPGMGVLYSFEILLFVGLLFFLFRKGDKKPLMFLFFWLLVAPIPAALSTGVGYSANRAASMMPVLQIILSFGVLGWVGILRKINKKVSFVLVFIFALLVIKNVYGFINIYFFNTPAISAKGMLYGNLESTYWLRDNVKDNSNFQVSKRLSEPHIYFAFTYETNPKIYQNSTKNWFYEDMGVNWVDQMPEYSYGNFNFRNIIWEEDSKQENIYMIGKPEEFPLDTKAEAIFYYPDNSVAIVIVKK